MIDFNKTSVAFKSSTSIHPAIKKRRRKVKLSKENKEFLQYLGLLK
jgi:hypothetical protein